MWLVHWKWNLLQGVCLLATCSSVKNVALLHLPVTLMCWWKDMNIYRNPEYNSENILQLGIELTGILQANKYNGTFKQFFLGQFIMNRCAHAFKNFKNRRGTYWSSFAKPCKPEISVSLTWYILVNILWGGWVTVKSVYSNLCLGEGMSYRVYHFSFP